MDSTSAIQGIDATCVVQIIVLLILLILSAFFSSAETSFTTLNQVRIRSLVEEGDKKASLIESILNSYSKMLSTILIGNNIVNIAASSLATTLAIKLWGSYAIGFVTGLLTLLVLLFGEIIPKTWASINNEAISRVYAPIIRFLMTVFTPVIYIIDKLSNIVMRMLHIDTNAKNKQITENEIKTYVDVGHEDGVIETEEREMIYNLFEFSDAQAKDIMIPRIDMTTVALDSSYEQLKDVFRESMFTRIPVYDEDPDRIVGLVNVKDFLLVDQPENFKISNILRDAYYTYEFKKTADLLIEMRGCSNNIAFVLSEYGTTVGMITMEDILEEIVGEIRDEYDEDEEELIQKQADGSYLVEGGMRLSDINDAINSAFDSENYDSIAGLMIEKLERLPEDQEVIALEDGSFLKAMGIQHNRISKVLITLPLENSDSTDKNL